jgi:hypothetical protein
VVVAVVLLRAVPNSGDGCFAADARVPVMRLLPDAWCLMGLQPAPLPDDVLTLTSCACPHLAAARSPVTLAKHTRWAGVQGGVCVHVMAVRRYMAGELAACLLVLQASAQTHNAASTVH